jgi:cation:H+ antiporter
VSAAVWHGRIVLFAAVAYSTVVSDPLLGATFALAAAVSLGASWLLVRSLERVGARMRLSEALLGMLAALAADAPEITAAVTAIAHGSQRIGAGVVIGSNVFNLAALIGLSGLVAGRVALHRRVIELAGGVALWIAAVTLLVVTGGCSPTVGLVLVGVTLGVYVVILGVSHERIARLRLPTLWTRWLIAAITEEELELEVAIHPQRGRSRDVVMSIASVAVVVGASVAMEQSAAKLGARHGVSEIVVGGLVLAGVTSLPNAVAGVYLAMRGRAAATLSTSFNSNAINVLAGLLIPTTLLGIGAPSTQTTFVTASYVAMTVLVIGSSYAHRGLRRSAGIVIVTAYLVFVGVLVGGVQ